MTVKGSVQRTPALLGYILMQTDFLFLFFFFFLLLQKIKKPQKNLKIKQKSKKI